MRQRRIVKQKGQPEPPSEFKKGMLLAVKAPPYYSKAYLYEVTSAGDKLIRATLYHSPTVKKSWGKQELTLMIEMGVIRLATEKDIAELGPQSAP